MNFSAQVQINKLITTAFLMVLASVSYGQAESALDETLSIDRLSWLTGNWKGPRDGGVLEEIWLPPLAGTITALVRSSEASATRFVEIIHITELNDSLELNLQLFNNSLEPESINAHNFELTEISSSFVSFKGISDGSHRSLSYERPEENIFFIRIETNDGEQIEIRLTLVE